MRRRNGFTLLELLIAMAISGFIIISMMQSFRNAQKMLSRSRTILHINKSVCLMFNQIERDFNTAIIPTISEPIKKEKKPEKTDKADEKKKQEEKPAKQAPQKKAKNKKKEKKPKILFFRGEAEEDKKRIGEKRYQLFQKVSFVNTNPLQVWGQEKQRLVRVEYSLVKNKENKKSFDLYRKETTDLKNEKFKEPEETDNKKTAPIRKHLIATNIRELFIEYIMPEPKKKKTKFDIEEEPKTIEQFTWGKDKKTKNVVPQKVAIRVTFWSEDMKRDKTYACIIPILSYPTEPIQKAKPAQKPDQKQAKQEPKKKAPATAKGARKR